MYIYIYIYIYILFTTSKHKNDTAIMIEFFEVLRHLVCNTLTILFSANCKSIQSWKQKLII